MKLTQLSESRFPAYGIAISEDEKSLAVVSEKIRVFSLPEMKLKEVISVKNAGCACFLGDNRSMLIINTMGELYFWNGEKVRRVGKVLGECYQGKLFYDSENDVVVFAAGKGIYRFDADNLQCRKIYDDSEREMTIVSCSGGQVLLLIFASGCDYQKLELLTIGLEGNVLRRVWTQKKIQTGWVSDCPAISPKGDIAVATVEKPCLFHSNAINLLYLIDQDGSVIAQRRLLSGMSRMNEINKVIYVRGCFVVLNQLTVNFLGLTQIEFYDTKDLSLLYEFKMNEGEINPVTNICITKVGYVYIGTWTRMYMLHMEQ